mgnify:FL=1|jgi:uncharacterized protein with PQ loop repeat
MTKMNIIDLCGIVSSVIIVVMFIPEIYHVYKHKDAKAINYSFLHLNVISSVLALVYGITYNVTPMIINQSAMGIFALLMYYFKHVYESSDTVNFV